MTRRFKTGEELAQFVKHQINVEIKVDDTLKGKPRKGIVYMEIPNLCPVWSLLAKVGVKSEAHIKDKYFVYLV